MELEDDSAFARLFVGWVALAVGVKFQTATEFVGEVPVLSLFPLFDASGKFHLFFPSVIGVLLDAVTSGEWVFQSEEPEDRREPLEDCANERSFQL